MPLPNGRNVSAKHGRSKSTSAATGKLPPVVSQETRERAEAMKKAFDRPKTAHRNSRPPTSNFALPTFGNGRLPTSSKHMKMAMNRSNSETRPLPKIEYGRSPSREKLTDLRDELFQAKKKVAGYETDLKKLSTEMQRLRRDADKRETFLERIVTAQYHPTELNDTNLARTLTSIKHKEIAKEKMIDIQAKELDRLRNLLKDHHVPLEQKHPTQSMQIPENPESESDDDEQEDESDYPEEPDQLENNDEEFDEVFEEVSAKKNAKAKEKPAGKDRNALAKKYAEQNAKLKEKLKEVRTNYVSMVEKNKKKAEDYVKQSENSKAVVEKTVEMSTVLDTLRKERENLSEIRKKNEEKIEDLSQELIEAYGEIDALKMHNEQLQDNLRELEGLVGNVNVNLDYESRPPLNIPRLDMTDVGYEESTESTVVHQHPEETSIPSVLSEFDHDHLASALAEIAGAHCERLKLIRQ